MINIWILILLVAILTSVPVFLVRKYIVTKNFKYIIIAILIYVFELVAYIKLFERGNIPIYFSISKILSIIFVVIVFVIFFSTKLNFKKIIGLLLGSIAIFLLA